MARNVGDITDIMGSDDTINAFTEGEEHALRELSSAARDNGLTDELRELLKATGYCYPEADGAWVPA